MMTPDCYVYWSADSKEKELEEAEEHKEAGLVLGPVKLEAWSFLYRVFFVLIVGFTPELFLTTA